MAHSFVFVWTRFDLGVAPYSGVDLIECDNEAEFFHILAIWNAAPENAGWKYSAAVPTTEAQHALVAKGATFADVKERIGVDYIFPNSPSYRVSKNVGHSEQ